MSEFHVFTTALVKNGEVRFLDEHLKRLEHDARHFDLLDLSCQRRLASRISELKEEASLRSYDKVLVKISLFADKVEITTRPAKLPSSLCTAPIVVTNLCVDGRFAAFKTSERDPYQQAQTLALSKGAFEALLINDQGYVVDGSRSSPLLFKNNVLYSLEGGLQGVTREKALKEARALGIPTTRALLKPDQLSSGIIFIAGSGIGLVSERTCDDDRIRHLQEMFRIG